MKRKLFIFGLIIVFCISFASLVIADIGNLNRYDSYDSNDAGGWSFDSSSDSGTSGLGSIFFGDSDDDSEQSGNIIIPIFIVVIVAVIIITRFSKAPPDSNHYRKPEKPIETLDKTEEITNIISSNDQLFSKEQFISFAKETYLSLQNAWMEKDLEKIRLLESAELFKQHQTQLEEFKKLGHKNVMERIAIKNVYFTDFSTDGAQENLKIVLLALMRDYIIEEKTGKLIAGRKDIDASMKYLMTFSRTKGSITKNEKGIETTDCPNCGAPTEITSSGKCSYCGSLITSGKYAWILSDMKSI